MGKCKTCLIHEQEFYKAQTAYCDICDGVEQHVLYPHCEMKTRSCVEHVCCPEGMIQLLEDACPMLKALLNHTVYLEKKNVLWNFDLLNERHPPTDECTDKLRIFAEINIHQSPVKYEHMSAISILNAYAPKTRIIFPYDENSCTVLDLDVQKKEIQKQKKTIVIVGASTENDESQSTIESEAHNGEGQCSKCEKFREADKILHKWCDICKGSMIFSCQHLPYICTGCGGCTRHGSLKLHREVEILSCARHLCCPEAILDYLEPACEDLRRLLNLDIRKEKKDVFWEYEKIVAPGRKLRTFLSCRNMMREFAKCIQSSPVKYVHMSLKSLSLGYLHFLDRHENPKFNQPFNLHGYAAVWSALVDHDKFKKEQYRHQINIVPDEHGLYE